MHWTVVLSVCLSVTLLYCGQMVSIKNYWNWTVGWSLTSLFSTNTAISEIKTQGWTVILLPSEGRLAIH